MEYKGYHTRIEFDAESMLLRGKIEGINDYVDFEADNISSIEQEFHTAVDDYLDFCSEVGKQPEKEYKGTFNIRISPELHRKLALRAFLDNQSLNSEVEKALSLFINNNQYRAMYTTANVKASTDTIHMDSSVYENEKTLYNNVIQFNLKHTYQNEAKSL